MLDVVIIRMAVYFQIQKVHIVRFYSFHEHRSTVLMYAINYVQTYCINSVLKYQFSLNYTRKQ